MFKEDEVIEYDGELAADTLVEFLLDVSPSHPIQDPPPTSTPITIPGGNPGVRVPEPPLCDWGDPGVLTPPSPDPPRAAPP